MRMIGCCRGGHILCRTVSQQRSRVRHESSKTLKAPRLRLRKLLTSAESAGSAFGAWNAGAWRRSFGTGAAKRSLESGAGQNVAGSKK